MALGRAHAGKTVSVAGSDTTLAIELDDPKPGVVLRTTTTPVRNIKADRPWTVPSVSWGQCQASPGTEPSGLTVTLPRQPQQPQGQ